MDENKDVAALLRDAVSGVLDEVKKVPVPQSNHQHLTIHHADPPPAPLPPPWHVWVCATAAVVSALVAGCAVGFAMDARGEMRANNSNRENDIRELRQTDNAIRAYINAGKVPVKTEENVSSKKKSSSS